MQTIRPQLALAPLRERQRGEHAGCLGLGVAPPEIRLRRAGSGLAQAGGRKIDAGTHALRLGGDDNNAREPVRRGGSEQFGKKEFREEERAEMVNSHLAFDVVCRCGVNATSVSSIVNENLGSVTIENDLK